MENLRFLHNRNINMRPDLRSIHAVINDESNLLHVTLSSLEESFDRGLAIALIPEDSTEAIGFVRFTPLLDEDLKQDLGLNNIPSIWEIGSAAIAPYYRGRGLYTPLRNDLLATVSQEMKDRRLLILGTTKNIAIIKVLDKAKDLGIEFFRSVHTDFPMIAPFTCICTPDFGCGFQLAENCPARVTQQQLIQLDEIAESSADGTKIPCVMYVSDKSLAERIDYDLMVKFGGVGLNPQRSLVSALKAKGYYD